MNYYQHHIGDFIRDTARLSDSQCMAYLRMLWMYYETENPLIDDADAVAFRIGSTAPDVHQILRHFFFLHEGMWHHSRCDKEILSFRGKSEKAKKSADARWRNANAVRTQCERSANEPVSDANQEPITNNQEPIEKHKRVPRYDARATLIGLGAEGQVVSDYLTLRKAKRAPVTQTVIDDLQREAGKAGLSLSEALTICCRKGWQGFDASWNWQGVIKTHQPAYKTASDKRKDFLNALTGRSEPEALPYLDGEASHVT